MEHVKRERYLSYIVGLFYLFKVEERVSFRKKKYVIAIRYTLRSTISSRQHRGPLLGNRIGNASVVPSGSWMGPPHPAGDQRYTRTNISAGVTSGVVSRSETLYAPRKGT